MAKPGTRARARALAPGPRQTCSGTGRPAWRPRVRARGRALRVPEHVGRRRRRSVPAAPPARMGGSGRAIPPLIRHRRMPPDAFVPRASLSGTEAIASSRDPRPGARGAAPGLRLTSRAPGAPGAPSLRHALTRAPSRARSVRPPPLDHAKLDLVHAEQVQCAGGGVARRRPFPPDKYVRVLLLREDEGTDSFKHAADANGRARRRTHQHRRTHDVRRTIRGPA